MEGIGLIYPPQDYHKWWIFWAQ